MVSEPTNYSLEFLLKVSTYKITLVGDNNGDFSLLQELDGRHRNQIAFGQGGEKCLFMVLLKHCYEQNIGLIQLRESMAGRIHNLPNLRGNFCEMPMRPVEEAFSYFLRELSDNPEKTMPLPDEGFVIVDSQQNLLFCQGKYNKPAIVPPKAMTRLIYGIAYIAAYGLVRTTRKELEERLNYFNERKFIPLLERLGKL